MLKGEVQNAQYRKEISQMAKIQEEQKHNERAQQEMLDLLQLQMANQDEDEEEDSATRSPSISSQDERHAGEIRHLTDTISNLEDRIDEYSEILEQKTEEIRTIGMCSVFINCLCLRFCLPKIAEGYPRSSTLQRDYCCLV